MSIKTFLLSIFSFLAVFLLISCGGEAPKEATESDEPEAEITKTPAATDESRLLMYVVHDVADYDAWKPGFDAHDSIRLANGIHSIGVARNMENPNTVHISFFIDDIDKAKAFAGSDELKKVMEEVGVVGPPDIHYMKEEYIVTEPTEITERVMIMHEVKDYDAWKVVFDADDSNRREFGLSDRALLRGVDNPNMVYIVFAFENEEKARAMVSSEELKNKMAEAGVIGAPDIQFINWAELNVN
jgi:hypothetical protein